MLCGHATAKVDDKGRFKVPSEFASGLEELCGGERRVYVTSRDTQRILVYPWPLWVEHLAALKKLPSADPLAERLRLAINFWGRETQIDPQGRIRIHSELLRAVGIDGTISVFGMTDMLEIWDQERVHAMRPRLDSAELAQIADKYGI